MSRVGLVAPTALLAALALLACGSSQPRALRVSAASSLRRALTRYAAQVKGAAVRFSFAGSDALAAQIEQGAHPDVFASANVQLPAKLFAKRLVERPVEFAANRLALAVPTSSGIARIADFERPGVKLAVGASSVPVGAYTASALSRLPARVRNALRADIRDREPDVAGIVGKLLEGAVDAGFVYRSDVLASSGRLRAIALPSGAEPRIAYAAAVVRGSSNRAAARAFVAGLLGAGARAEFRADGFLGAGNS